MRDNEIDYFVVFIDLTKVNDSIKHEIIYLELRKMGAPDKCVMQVEKLCGDSNMMLNI